MADAETHTEMNPAGLAELGLAVEAGLMELAQPVVRGAQAMAPKRTGLGAASIHAEFGEQSSVDISWSRERYYMKFHELGSVHLPARPFLVPALDRYL